MNEQNTAPCSASLIEDAFSEAAALEALIEQSPIKDKLQPAIFEACARVEEAAGALENTPEYAAFMEKVHALGELLQEARRLLEQ